jgi:AraC-like DNA-binding protein
MRIERIGTAALPGVRAIEWHTSPQPDGHFLRLPLADVVLTINLGVVGLFRYRGHGDTPSPWQPFPRIALRGICDEPSEGADPPEGAISYVSVVFEPWALPGYLGVEARCIARQIVPAEVHCSHLRRLDAKLRFNEPGSARLARVAEWMHSQWDAARVRQTHREVLEQLYVGHDVATVAGALAVSARRVHQLCRNATGHSPTAYRQIARFSRIIHALHATHASPVSRWTSHVREFSDHSHAIRSFRRLATVSPRAYAEARSPATRSWSVVRTGESPPGANAE